MTVVIINPGAGPISGRCTLENAYANMDALLKDAGLTDALYSRDMDAEESDGRFSFCVAIKGFTEEHGTVAVDMPGLPLSQVRYSGKLPTPIPPRLYVDGSSWWWPFATSILRDWLKDHEEAEREDREWKAAQRQGVDK